MTQVQTSQTFRTVQEFDYKQFTVPSNVDYTLVEETDSQCVLERDYSDCKTKCVANLIEIEPQQLEEYFQEKN